MPFSIGGEYGIICVGMGGLWFKCEPIINKQVINKSRNTAMTMLNDKRQKLTHATTKLLLLAASPMFAFAVLGDGIGYGSYATNYVATGEPMVQTDPVMVGDGDLHKTGDGTWSVDQSLITMSGHPIHVNAGVVTVTSGGETPTISEPAVIRERAVMWLSTKDGERNVKIVSSNGNDYVDFWYDVRETNVSTPSYRYAKALRKNGQGGKTVTSPTLTTVNGKPSIYFGGYGSGRTMRWMTAAGANVEGKGARHVFVVTCTTKRMGPLFGCATSYDTFDVGYFPLNYSDKNKESGYYTDGRAPARATRLYRNGEEISPSTTYPRKNELEVLDIDINVARFGLNAFFTERLNTDVPRSGGDHILEAIVFERPLTQDQRVEIEAYLMNKWGVSPARFKFDVAKDGEVVVESGVDVLVDGYGPGLVRKQTADTLVVKNDAGRQSADVAVVALDNGSVQMLGRQPLAIEGGRALDATTLRESCGYTVSTSASSKQGLFEKTGAEEVYVERVEPSVEKLSIEEGRVVVSPIAKRTATKSIPLEIPLKNPSFERGAGSSGCTSYGTGGFTFEGWKLGVSDFATAVCEFAICSNRSYYAASQAVATKDRAPDGNCLGVLRGKMTIEQDVVLPEDGIYELSFWICGRWDVSQKSNPLGVYLIDKATSAQVVFAEALPSSYDEFTPYGVSFKVSAGTYTLKFGNVFNGDITFSLDDFHLRKTADAFNARSLIPGGNFESVTYTSGSSVKYSPDNIQPGWTFEQAVAGKTNVTIVTAGCTYINGLHNNCASSDNPMFPARRMPKCGTAAVAFLTNGTIRTTFTPHQGVWRLKANCTPYCMKSADSCASVLSAVIQPSGGAAIDLGSLSGFAAGQSRDYCWNSFEADGLTPMTLEVAFRAQGLGEMTVDDFDLVRAEGLSDVNLVNDGGFESLGAKLNGTNSGYFLNQWDFYKTLNDVSPIMPGDSVNQVGGRLYSDTAAYWSSEVYDGASFLALWSGNNVRQEIAFPQAGLYRLTLNLAAMGQTYNDMYPNLRAKDRFLMALVKPDGSETNWIMQAAVVSTNFVERAYDFYISEPCTRTLVLGNPRGMTTSDWTWEWGVCVDGVSIREVAEPDAPCIPESVWLDFSGNGSIYLGFSGTNALSKVSIGGKRVTGVISAKTHPGLVQGPGVLLGLPSTNGLIMIVE